MQFLDILWLGMPVWIWLTFLGAVLAILAFDLGVMHRDSHEIGVGESLRMSALYIGVGLAWAGAVWWIYAHYADAGALDPQIAAAAPDERAWTAVELYLTGYLVEKTLAMDNVFIISMIFGYFAVPREYQHRVLFWGILGVIVLRAIMIGLGAALVMEFTWVMYLFGVVLLATGIKMLVMVDRQPDIAANPVLRLLRRHLRVTDELHGQAFTVRRADPRSGKAPSPPMVVPTRCRGVERRKNSGRKVMQYSNCLPPIFTSGFLRPMESVRLRSAKVSGFTVPRLARRASPAMIRMRRGSR